MGSSVSAENEKFIAKFNEFGLDGVKFCNLLKQSNAVIVGDFPMQILMNKQITNDCVIEIYTENDKILEKYLRCVVQKQPVIWGGCHNNREEYNHLQEYKHLEKYGDFKEQAHFEKYDHCKEYEHVKQFYLPGQHFEIQIRKLRKDAENKINILEYARDLYILDFCKIIFDGEKVIRYDNGTFDKKECVLNMDVFNTKYADVDECKYFHHLIKTYTLRGFTIIVKYNSIEVAKINEGIQSTPIIGQMAVAER